MFIKININKIMFITVSIRTRGERAMSFELEDIKNSSELAVSGLLVYILAGWKALKDFVGPTAATLMRNMGEYLYQFLIQVKIVNTFDFKNLEDLRIDALQLCKLFKFPIKEFKIFFEGNKIKVQLFEDLSECNTCKILSKDDAWVMIPVPLISLVYFILTKKAKSKLRPIRYNFGYDNGIWTYVFEFDREYTPDDFDWKRKF